MPQGATIKSGVEAADNYIANGYETVKGMSSSIAASICCALLRIQAEFGVSGHIVEIGAFEGRFFIALAHCLNSAEMALGIDSFDWPDDGIRARFEENCRRHGVGDKFISWAVDSNRLSAADIRTKLPSGAVRFIHIDGDHQTASFESDLRLATEIFAPGGLIVLDDMLHPGYPLVMASLQRHLERHPELAVLCIIDRENIVAASKFVLCRTEWFKRYEDALLKTFKDFVWPLGANFESYRCLVLSRDTRLAAI